MFRGSAVRWTAAPLSLVMLLGACYRYVPETGAGLTAGAAYRGHLSAQGAERMAPVMGAGVSRFDGRVVAASDTGFLFAMGATVKRTDPRPAIWSGEQLFVPRFAVERFERRELDRSRTVRAAVLGAAAFLAVGTIWLSIKGKVGGSPPGGPGPTPF